MSIILGALGGLGEGLQKVGGTMLQNDLETDRQKELLDRRTQAERKLMQDRMQIEAQAQENLIRLKQRLSDEEHQKTLGRIRGAVDTSGLDTAASSYSDPNAQIDDGQGGMRPLTDEERQAGSAAVAQAKKGVIDNAMSDPTQARDAAIRAGEFDVAKGLDSMAKNDEKLTSVPFGSQLVDKNGNVVADNGSDLRGEYMTASAEAKKAAADAKANKEQKDLTQKQGLDMQAKAEKLFTDTYGDKTNPFDDGLDDKKAKDSRYLNLGKQLFSSYLMNQSQGGKKNVDAASVMDEVTSKLDEYDATLQDEAQARADQLFDKKGKPIDSEVQKAVAAGWKKSQLTDPSTFMRAYRDGKLNADSFRNYLRSSSDQAPAEQPAPAARPQVRPAAKPSAPIIDRVRNPFDNSTP